MPSKVVIAGGTGFIGSHLIPYLQKEGHEITILTTKSDFPEQRGIRFFKWNPGSDPEPDLLAEIAGSTAVINLAGASISKRWSNSYKNELFQSRIDSTFTLVSAINSTRDPPLLLVNSSAVGYYGDRGSEALTEESAPGTDFLARLATSWEDEAKKVNSYATKLVIARFGAVFGTGGGAFPVLYNLYSKGRGAKFDLNENWMSWVHIDDACRAILFLMKKDETSGVYNVTSPNPASKEELQQTMMEELELKSLLKAPKSLIRLIGGEGALTQLYTSEKALPQRLNDLGFDFKHSDLRETISELVQAIKIN